MTALAAGTQRNSLSDPTRCHGGAYAGSINYQGGIAMVDTSGYVRPAAASVSGAICAGIVQPGPNDIAKYDNSTGSSGDIDVLYYEGVFGLKNDSGSPILATTQRGTILYAVDDQTVSLSSSSGTRAVAGRLWGYDTSCNTGPVLVEMSADIAKQATEQLAAQTDFVTVPVVLVGHSNGSIAARFTPGYAGTILSLTASVVIPVTTAAKLATFTPAIATVATTGGALALTSANCTPVGAKVNASAITAANTFGASDEITIAASSVTAFSEGEVVFYLKIQKA